MFLSFIWMSKLQMASGFWPDTRCALLWAAWKEKKINRFICGSFKEANKLLNFYENLESNLIWFKAAFEIWSKLNEKNKFW